MNTVLAQYAVAAGKRLLLVLGDITEERVDAIVNPANSALAHAGGLAAAICRKGGPSIQAESDAIGGVPVGRAAITGAGRLPCRFVIHAVGPVWGSGDEDERLRSALRSSLALAEDQGLTTISVPAISSGIFGFPKDRCADVLLKAARDYLSEHPDRSLSEVRFCLFDEPTIRAFQDSWRRLFGPN